MNAPMYVYANTHSVAYAYAFYTHKDTLHAHMHTDEHR